MAPRVEVLYFDGCPGHEALLPRLREAVRDAGFDPAAIELRQVTSPDDAESERFLGSPTVRVDGRDVDPSAADRDDFGLKCRLYREDGQQARTPPEAWIRAALTSAPPTP